MKARLGQRLPRRREQPRMEAKYPVGNSEARSLPRGLRIIDVARIFFFFFDPNEAVKRPSHFSTTRYAHEEARGTARRPGWTNSSRRPPGEQ